jgi:hypothetical protein
MKLGGEYRLFFQHDWVFAEAEQRADIEDQDAIAVAYEVVVRQELTPLVRAGELETHGRRQAPVGGGGYELVDWVAFSFGALEAYAALRFAGDDVRRVVRKLRRKSKGRVYVDRNMAVLLAVESVSHRESAFIGYEEVALVDIELVSVTDLIDPTSDIDRPASGFIVSLSVNRDLRSMVVNHDGSIIGATSIPDLPNAESVEQERRYAVGDFPVDDE